MKILVDADACPVKDIIVKVAKKHQIPVIMFVDTSHVLGGDYSEIITVDKQKESVDIALINRASTGDIVVTQDYGLAALALGKGAKAINQNGLIYSSENIDQLLFERHLSQKTRRAGGRTKGPAKRNKQNDLKFGEALVLLINQITM